MNSAIRVLLKFTILIFLMTLTVLGFLSYQLFYGGNIEDEMMKIPRYRKQSLAMQIRSIYSLIPFYIASTGSHPQDVASIDDYNKAQTENTYINLQTLSKYYDLNIVSNKDKQKFMVRATPHTMNEDTPNLCVTGQGEKIMHFKGFKSIIGSIEECENLPYYEFQGRDIDTTNLN